MLLLIIVTPSLRMALRQFPQNSSVAVVRRRNGNAYDYVPGRQHISSCGSLGVAILVVLTLNKSLMGKRLFSSLPCSWSYDPVTRSGTSPLADIIQHRLSVYGSWTKVRNFLLDPLGQRRPFGRNRGQGFSSHSHRNRIS